MRRVPRPTIASVPALFQKVADLCDASQQETEAAADAFDLRLPPGFTEVHTLDLTTTPTTAQLAAAFATFIRDLQRRGTNRKLPND